MNSRIIFLQARIKSYARSILDDISDKAPPELIEQSALLILRDIKEIKFHAVSQAKANLAAMVQGQDYPKKGG